MRTCQEPGAHDTCHNRYKMFAKVTVYMLCSNGPELDADTMSTTHSILITL